MTLPIDPALVVPSVVGALILGTFYAGVKAIEQYEKPKPPPILTLAWVHEGLREPKPLDPSLLALPDYWWGAPTGAWPMILELRDDADETARSRFEASVAELGVTVPEPAPAMVVPSEWSRHTFDDPSGVRMLVTVGGAA